MNERQLARRVKAESARLAETEYGVGGQKEQEMIAQWREQRPKMVARLERMGILAEFAHLIETKRGQAMDANRKAGMGWPDSREQANLDWLIADPETDDEEQEADLNALMERMTQAPRERLPRAMRREIKAQPNKPTT